MTTTAQTPGFRFSYKDVQNRDGMALWREVMGRTVLRIDLELLPGRPFHSEVSTLALPGAQFAFATKSGLRMERARRFLADGDDDVALHMCTAGPWIVSSRGDEIRLGGNEAVLVSNAEVASVVTPSLSRCTCVRLPRKVLAPLVADLDDAPMLPIPRTSEALKLLIRYAEALRADRAPTTPALQALVATHVRDLVAVALGASRDVTQLAEQGGIRAARLHAIKSDIRHRIDRPDLSVVAVAARQGISARYVQALFENDGTTFSEFVLRERLARVHRMLTDSANSHRTISDIAFANGFGDLSHFNRAFRRRYGATPSEVRAAAKIGR
jgi:AraC-like DNA-binding protein